MAKTFTAPFAQTVNTSNCVVTTANGGITTDTVTNTVLLFTAGTEGSIISAITAMPRATVAATSLYLFTSADNGTTLRLIDSVLMPAQTLGAALEVTKTSFYSITEDYPLRLEANEKLYASIGVTLASGIVFYARGMDY
jgi:hypothetical protein